MGARAGETIISHIGTGDLLSLKIVEAICAHSVPTIPSGQRCIENPCNLVYLVVNSLLAFESLGKEEDIQLAWTIIETTPTSLNMPPSAPTDQREDALHLSLMTSSCPLRYTRSSATTSIHQC